VWLIFLLLTIVLQPSLLAHDRTPVVMQLASPSFISFGAQKSPSVPFPMQVISPGSVQVNNSDMRDHLWNCQNIQSSGWNEIQNLCRNKSEQQLFNDFTHYANPYHRYLISQQTGYENFVLNLHQKITQNHGYRKSLRYVKGFFNKYDFLKLIDGEVDRIKAARQERERQQLEAKRKLEATAHRLQINNRNEYQELIEICNLRAHDAVINGNDVTATRNQKRITAAHKTLENPSAAYDYSHHIKSYPLWKDPDADAFNNRYGTPLDQQLHEELCDTRLHMMKLTTAYPSSDYPHFYAPIVYHCTAQAKQESNPTVAFSLADFSDAIVNILSRGIQIITDVAVGSGEGLVSGIKTVLSAQHWVDLAKSIPLFLMHSIAFLSNEYAQQQSIDQALMIGDHDLFMKRCCDYEEQCRLRMKPLEAGLTHVASLSWRELALHATYFGTTIALDCIGLHALKLAASSTGRELVGNIARTLQSSKAPQIMAEVAGVGKIAVEEGIEVARTAVEISQTIKSTLPAQIHPHEAIQNAYAIVKVAEGLRKETTHTICKTLVTDQEFVSSSLMGEGITDKLRNFISRTKSKLIGKKIQTGAQEISAEEFLAGEAWAEKQYDLIRMHANDAQMIANHTGLPIHKVNRIKKHLFYDKHILYHGVDKLYPSKPIAEAWSRLMKGIFSVDDLKLLEHEYFEAKFETIFKTTNRIAHDKTELRRPSPLVGK
jgi:hypothetical protein